MTSLLPTPRATVVAVVVAVLLAAVRRWLRLRALRRSAVVREAVATPARFAEVRRTFEANILEGREAGAQLVCFVDGEKQVDLSGGSDAQRQLWPESLVNVFSCSKVVESLAIAMLADRGLLEYDAPVARYWPRFGQVVSPETTVGDLMRYQAGVSGLTRSLTLEEGLEVFSDADRLLDYIESQQPEWRPQRPPKRQLYHALTRGLYSGELVRRVTGKSIRDFVADEIVAKASAPVEFTVGAPPHLQHRVAEHFMLQTKLYIVARYVAHLVLPERALDLLFAPLDRLKPFELEIYKGLITKAENRRALRLFGDMPLSLVAIANNPDVRALPLASATGISNARSLAQLANDVVLGNFLSTEGLQSALHLDEDSHSVLKDDALCRKVKISNCGWGLDRFDEFGPEGWVGWAGAGGSLFVFHPERKAVMAYIVNGLVAQQYKARGVRLLQAFNDAVAKAT